MSGEEKQGYMASGSLEEIKLDIVVFHADGTSTDYGTVSRTNFKEQAEASQPKSILNRISNKVKEIGSSNG
jgi:hypothetical protein